MKAVNWFACVGAALLVMGLAGCSFSIGNVQTIKGKEALVVKAEQPPAPVKKAPAERKARVVGQKIEITEKVMFDYNEASIKGESHELLGDVADVIKEHAEIKKLQIEGHTDSDGTNEYNKDLSQRRATAVMDFLVDLGVDEAVMGAVGFGEETPISDNNTDEGKEKNRRVEFNIVERAGVQMGAAK